MMFRILGHSDTRLVVHLEGEGLLRRTLYPNPERIFLIHAISFPASTAVMYSVSVVERATIVWILLYHPIALPAIIVTYSAVEHPVSTQSPWEASV